ncbi:putative Outer membrane autotransporter barrel domain protein [uncultured Sporomusa sp.]|uniref:Putative Outer membrane autotransporter barrel domain protein n=1 Tax=uncultured Sporomusa sp. TaxID=307249 RepID=A0A212LZW6_9FIRM|nr:putative Outer membrane autotransporter barrel domain protein [uncultured Sporomusa sp.]
MKIIKMGLKGWGSLFKLSEHAIGMLVSKYRAVLKRMLIRNTAAFAACCVILGAPAAGGAAGITYTGDGAALQTAPIGGASSPSLILSGVSGNTVTVDYTTGTDPWRVFGGLSNSAAVIGNTVYLFNGTVNNNFYGGYDAAGTGGFGAGNNTVIISGGTVISNAVAGLSLQGNVSGNRMTMSGGTVGRNLYGGSANGSGSAVGNSVLVTGGQVGDGLGDVGNGWVVGGFSQDGLAENNRVTLTAGTVNSIEGGESGTGVAANNQVIITGGTVAGVVVRGGFSNTGSVINNRVDISGGSMDMDVMAGQTNGGDAINNQVTVTGGTIGQFIFGGISDAGEASGNRVIMSDGTVTGYIRGGDSIQGNALNNGVIFSGGRVSGIEGGYSRDGNASGNTVDIRGGEVVYAVFGGFSNNGDAAGNTVILSGAPQLSNALLYGGFCPNGASSGNTLQVNGFTGSVKEVAAFQNYNFFLSSAASSGSPVLNITGAIPVDLAGTTVSITGLESGVRLAAGDEITLISSTANAPAATYAANVLSGISLLYDLDIRTQNAKLIASVNSAGINPQTKALAEGRASGMAFLNQGADLAAGSGITDAAQQAKAAGGQSTFGAVSYGSSRHNTGSHADVDGTSLLAGWASRHEGKNGLLTRGVFLEGGWGSYDTYNSFAGLPDVKGGGDTSYYGLGVLFRQDRPDGSYLEGSLRGGKSKTDFASGDLKSSVGEAASYSTDSAYYGLHAGIGRIKCEGGRTLDYYAKYFYTHQGGNDVTVAGDRFSFDAADSSRLRGGVRLTTEKPGGKIANYVGLAYEYEFSGKARGSVHGLSLDAPSLRGGTGILELGLSVKSRPDSSNTLHFGLQGFAGKREGVTGTAQFKRMF